MSGKEVMSVSTKGINFLKQVEALRTEPYDDATGEEINNWTRGATIGYGHLIPNNEWEKYKDGIDEDKAEKLLKTDLKPFERVVRRNVTKELDQSQFDALVILAFNIGKSGLRTSSVLKILNGNPGQANYNSLEAAWKAYNRNHTGKVNEGLKNRRRAELKIYNRGNYKVW